MKKLQAKLVLILATAMTVVTAFSPIAVRAADLPASNSWAGDWLVSTLAHNGEWKIEAYKVDRGLAAWTELDASGAKRRLYAYDGVKTRLLAEMSSKDWSNRDSYFVESVKGDFDVADGLVVWTMFDGQDREIFAFDGESVKKVSDNSYDDRHPITGGGRIAWTSQPNDGGQYNLMVREANGTVSNVASWYIMNYAFSGKTLFWQNLIPNQTWFAVYRNDGKSTAQIGKGDDRPMTSYFFTDGKGSAAWEYSTKNWNYDKREVYVSYLGQPSLRVMQRDVPPRNTRVEDTDNGNVMVNVYDWQYMRVTERNALIQTNGGGENTISQKESMSKVRYMDGGYVIQREPGVNISMVLRTPQGETNLTLEPIIKELFDADGASAAGARVGGGVVLYTAGKSDIAASTVEATDIDVQNGDVIWTEGSGDAKVLKFATSTVLVKTSAFGTSKRVSGFLVKTAGSSAVYLAANDGMRYLFPSATQFNDWYANFSSVRTVSKASLSSMPLVGNVLLRAGSHLVKTPSSSRVYAVGENGTLTALADASVAQTIFGKDWKSRIVTLGDSQLSDYKIGPSAASDLAYYAILAKQTHR